MRWIKPVLLTLMFTVGWVVFTSAASAAPSRVAASGSQVCVAQQGVPALPLRTAGRFIVDNNGRRFKLSGVSWYGAEGTDFVVAGLQVEPLAAIVRHIRCMGFNTVRLPWSNEMYESNPVVPDYAVTANPQLKGKHALQVFDAIVSELARQGLLVVLDNHGSNAQWCCSNDGNELWYNPQYPETDWIANWKGMVARYKNVPQVIGADLRNEPRGPATWGGDPATDWHAAAERGGNAVLSVNPNLLIFVEGVNYALDLTGAANLPIELNTANRLVYSAHDYPFDHNGETTYDVLKQEWDRQWGYLLTPGMPYTAPVWIGEFGNFHTQSINLTDANPSDGSGGFWFQSFRTYLDQNDIDWSYWPLNGTESSGQGRTYNGEDGYGILNPYWNQAAIPSELTPTPAISTLSVMQPLMAPSQGPGRPAANPPVVALTQPLPGSTIVSGASLLLQAAASTGSGSSDTISRVDYYASGRLIGSATAPPYQVVWNNIAPGQYSLQARAVTASGVVSRSQLLPFQAINYAGLQTTYASSIGVNFVSYAVKPMAATETAGAVPQANWNQALGNTNSGTITGLVDQGGNATTASVSWTSPNSYFTAITDQPGDNRMMKGYLDNNNVQPNTVQVSGLPATFGIYDVIVYFDGGNEGSNPPARVGNYRLTVLNNGRIQGCSGQTFEGSTITGLDAAGADFSGSFVQASGGSAGNYVKFTDCTGSGFSLAPIPGASSDTQYRAPVNGIQILAHAQ